MSRLKHWLLSWIVISFFTTLDCSGQAWVWGKNKEKITRGIFLETSSDTVWYEWRVQEGASHPKPTLLILRSDTSHIRQAFSIDDRSHLPSINLPGFIQVLYETKAGPTPGNFKQIQNGVRISWLEMPMESDICTKFSDDWKQLPSGEFFKDSTFKMEVRDMANMGHQRDTLSWTEAKWYAKGEKRSERVTFRVKIREAGDTLPPVWELRMKETYWNDTGKKQSEKVSYVKNGADSTVARGFHPGGLESWSLQLRGGVLNGACSRMTAGGQPLVQGSYLNGKRNGTWKEFYPDGLQKAEWEYIAGSPDDFGRMPRKLLNAWYPGGEKAVISGKGVYKVASVSPEGCSVIVEEEYKAGKVQDDSPVSKNCDPPNEWPGAEFTFVKGYRLGSESNSHDKDYAIEFMYGFPQGVKPGALVSANMVSPSYAGSGKTLTKTQAASLTATLNAVESFSARVADCDISETLYVFFDADNQPVGYVELGLQCQEVHSWPPLANRNDQNGYGLSQSAYKALSKLCAGIWKDGCDPLGMMEQK